MKMKDEGKTANDFSGRQKEVYNIFMSYNTRNQHKMISIPVCEIPKNLR
jgi:NAD+ synthase